MNEPRQLWYDIKVLPSVEGVRTQQWLVPEWVRGRVVLLEVAISCNTGRWDVGPVCRALFIE